MVMDAKLREVNIFIILFLQAQRKYKSTGADGVTFQSINQTTEDQIGTFREFSQIYNKMSDICFNLCVWDFGTDQVREEWNRS
jgi:hypothetical protein